MLNTTSPAYNDNDEFVYDEYAFLSDEEFDKVFQIQNCAQPQTIGGRKAAGDLLPQDYTHSHKLVNYVGPFMGDKSVKVLYTNSKIGFFDDKDVANAIITRMASETNKDGYPIHEIFMSINDLGALCMDIPPQLRNQLLPRDSVAHIVREVEFDKYSYFIVGVQAVNHHNNLTYDGEPCETQPLLDTSDYDEAIRVAKNIRQLLEDELDFPEPIVCKSTYGIDLLYPADILEHDQVYKLVNRATESLAAQFDCYEAFINRDINEIDICLPVYGTKTINDFDPDFPVNDTAIISVPKNEQQPIVTSDLVRLIRYRNVENLDRPKQNLLEYTSMLTSYINKEV